jgi:hypothetical protein
VNITISIDGEVAVKMDVNPSALAKLIQGVSLKAVTSGAKSTKATKDQMTELLSRIDPKSAYFLKQIAASDDGSITWGQMRAIFGIKNEDDWNAYSNSYGKGITRAFRHILNDKSARLIWWDQHGWDEEEEWDVNTVYIDGEALQALRQATGVAKL